MLLWQNKSDSAAMTLSARCVVALALVVGGARALVAPRARVPRRLGRRFAADDCGCAPVAFSGAVPAAARELGHFDAVADLALVAADGRAATLRETLPPRGRASLVAFLRSFG